MYLELRYQAYLCFRLRNEHFMENCTPTSETAFTDIYIRGRSCILYTERYAHSKETPYTETQHIMKKLYTQGVVRRVKRLIYTERYSKHYKVIHTYFVERDNKPSLRQQLGSRIYQRDEGPRD